MIAKKPDNCYAIVNLGKVYIAQKNWADAENILSDAATCAPKMAVVYESLGFALMKQKKLDSAITQFDKAMKIKPAAGTRSMIETCRENIRIRDANQAMDAREALQAEEAAKADAEFKEAERKTKAWEEAQRKRDD